MEPRPAILLFVEDNDTDMFLVKEIFKAKHISNTIEHVKSAEKALERLEDKTQYLPDLIFIDLNLHGSNMSGDELVTAIRRNNRYDDCTVAIITARDLTDLEKRNITDLRVDFVFPKPLLPINVLDMVEKSKDLWIQIFKKPFHLAA